MDINVESIKKIIVDRAYKLQFTNVYKITGGKPFILAGGSLCGDAINDFDIYPADGSPFNRSDIIEKISAKDWKLLATTANALTLNVNGQTLQLCSYCKNTLKELVDSFDFAHIQVGIRFRGDDAPPFWDDVYFTNEFVVSNLRRDTKYVGSEYPLSSLIRTFKYANRGKFSGRSYIRDVLNTLRDIIERGYKDYDDFKKQMDAIDLGLAGYEGAYELYEAMEERGLVKFPDTHKNDRDSE